MDSSIFSLLNIGIWRDALVTTLFAVAIWLMNFVPVVAPSALSVGLATSESSLQNCSVPTLNMTNDYPGQGLRLLREDYTETTFTPSQAAVDIVRSVAASRSHTAWSSPCGSNCSYRSSFNAPSLRCTPGASPYDPAANWSSTDGQMVDPHPWWTGFGDGSNVSTSALGGDDLFYANAYEATVNRNTSKLWVGISSPLAKSLVNSTATVSQFLNLTVFFCDIMNTSYKANVTYTNGQQTVNLTDPTYLNNMTISSTVWEGGFDGPDHEETVSAAGVVALYKTLYDLVTGFIVRDPRSELNIATNIAEIPALVRQVNISDVGQPTLLYIPDPGMLPHLEQLSRNMSLSLLANPQLAITSNVITVCSTSRTSLVWKCNRMILVAVHVPAVSVALTGLVLAGHAVLSDGVVRDKAFSTFGIMTTRDPSLNSLVHGDEDGALPLPQTVGRTKLGFNGLRVDSEGIRRRGFFLK